jgi:alpha-L-fucosidase
MKLSIVESYLKQIEQSISNGPFSPDWESLSLHRIPTWVSDAKLGIFVHWGVFTVPEFGNEWYARNMYRKGTAAYQHHLDTYGQHERFGYKDLIPLFCGNAFDAEEWIDLFHAAGAKYLVFLGEHHDGFQMYRSKLSQWNSYQMGPHRDVAGELVNAAHSYGIRSGISSHRLEHWFFFGHGRDIPSDVASNAATPNDLYWPAVSVPDAQIDGDTAARPAPSEEFMIDWMVRTAELIDRFHPSQLYLDWWTMHQAVHPYLKKIAAYYYNSAIQWNQEVTLAGKMDSFAPNAALPDVERGGFAECMPFPWQTDTSISVNSWCYTKQNRYKSLSSILCDLLDIISKNGCMLLNVGPRADGSICDEERSILHGLGRWMKQNKEAVYGSRPWKISREGPTSGKSGSFADHEEIAYTPEDIRFVTNHGCIYAFFLHYPDSGKCCIRSLARKDVANIKDFGGIISEVSFLGFDERPFWERDQNGLHIKTRSIHSMLPVTVKISLY